MGSFCGSRGAVEDSMRNCVAFSISRFPVCIHKQLQHPK
jgi:hypothetical protein